VRFRASSNSLFVNNIKFIFCGGMMIVKIVVNLNFKPALTMFLGLMVQYQSYYAFYKTVLLINTVQNNLKKLLILKKLASLHSKENPLGLNPPNHFLKQICGFHYY
jgi:hypothetical protein